MARLLKSIPSQGLWVWLGMREGLGEWLPGFEWGRVGSIGSNRGSVGREFKIRLSSFRLGLCSLYWLRLHKAKGSLTETQFLRYLSAPYLSKAPWIELLLAHARWRIWLREERAERRILAAVGK